ncbi:amidohydrolase family protein [Skermanella sp. TT6]|uniref:Amidohydrolase family protein n=1 Tax=Skermanella cutis TaxID=2775420 RepID=A0ABX7B140_9PROT|nr:amidohydrolase family protein [Skermanella sp. TT6]QQP87574.1 amidohydrolase family protein [Skermanella sp. TT6]
MTERSIACIGLLEGGDYDLRGPCRLSLDGGRIAGVAGIDGEADPLFALPVPVNAHDHGRPVRSSSFGAAGKPLELWLQYLALLPAVDPYLAAAASLGRSALGGAGAVMVHHTRVQGLTPLPREAAEVARAAADIGVRIGFAVAMKDRNPLVYGPSEEVLALLPEDARREVARRTGTAPMSVEDQIRLVEEVAGAAAGDMVDVQYGPTGVQWCTPGLLRAVAEASARTGRRVHMHCLETRYQRDWADRNFPEGMISFLKGIGLLSPRLTLAHCTWARPEELDLIAESGATIAVNTGSNLGIRSGIAPVAEMVARGCKVALGLDGLTLDEDDDALGEMRLANALHRGWGFDTAIDETAMLRIALANGRAAVTGRDEGGAIEPGAPADLLLLDAGKLDSDRLVPDLSPRDLLFARAGAGHVAEVIVAGRTIVRRGKVTGIDHDAVQAELLDRLRHGIRGNDALRAALPELGRALHRHFGAAPCC